MDSKGEGLPSAGRALSTHLKDEEPGQERRAGVSAVIITLNEEHHLGPCLDSLRWVDEIVVVDAGSTDRTVDLARAAGARVFVRDWSGYGLQKNFGFEQALGEWLLVIDADERVSDALADEIRGRLAAGALAVHAAYDVPRQNYFFGRWLRWGGAFPDRQIRLIRRGRARYNSILLHEQLLVDGTVGHLSGHLVHEAARTVTDRLTKLDRYADYAAIETSKRRRRVHWWDLLLRPAVIFGKLYILKQGFRDGLAGLIYCGLASLYEFTKYAKVWERTREGDGSVD
jgi:(heptosyl)LPS beta-1,4-glucosyltransferase